MERLCHLYLTPQLVPEARLKIMYMMFGAHYDEHDYHRVGFDQHYLGSCLQTAGFTQIRRVQSFHLFEDSSNMQFMGLPISINITAIR
jgi:predicted SAM-dependent methyltransferase